MFVCALHYATCWLFSFFPVFVLIGRTRIRRQDRQHQWRILDQLTIKPRRRDIYCQLSIIGYLSKKQGKHNLLSAHIWFRSISLLYLHTVPMYFGLYIEVSYIFASPRYPQPLFLAAIVLKCVYRQSLISAMLSHLLVSLYSTRLVNRSCEWT